MTETEKKALEQAVAAAGRRMQDYAIMAEENVLRQSIEAHARAIEQHEAFKREVSDAVEAVKSLWDARDWPSNDKFEALARFIIPKTDPLEKALEEAGYAVFPADLKRVRAAIEARGGRIVWEGDND